MATKEEDGRAPRAAVGGDAACGNPVETGVTLDGVEFRAEADVTA